MSDEPSTPPISEESEENELGAGLPPLKASNKADDEDDEMVVPAKKKRKLQIKSISYHKGVHNNTSVVEANKPPKEEEPKV